MTIPTYQELMLPLLQLASEGETRIPLIAGRIADRFGLAQAEREQRLANGQRLLLNRLAWAKIYLERAGLIAAPRRGHFLTSDAGRALLARTPDKIDLALLKSYPGFAAFYRSNTRQKDVSPLAQLAAEASESSAATPEEQIDAANVVLLSALKAHLLERVMANTPSFFERLIVDLLVAMGYGGSHEQAARQLGRGGDGGVDGVIDEDRLGLDRIYVQAKRYTSSVGRPEIQGFVGSLVGLGAGKGVFVTTSSFSGQAVDYARHLQQRVILIDGTRLVDLMVEYGVGVRVSRTVEVKRLDEDFFEEGIA